MNLKELKAAKAPAGSHSPAGRILRTAAGCVALAMLIPFVASEPLRFQS
jgi:hypothetical protein